MIVAHRRHLGWLLLALFLASGVPAAKADETVPLVVTSATGEHLFRVEVARTPEETAQGLMFREQMDLDAGMLFLFEPPRRVSFWMKNTLIPLDMIFADTGGRIVGIEADAEPGSLEPRGPDAVVRAVLEINGGLAEQLGIRVGDEIRTPLLAR
ncbi:MAG: DUF192 domain-containing protein [Pseudomonadota bacterium]